MTAATKKQQPEDTRDLDAIKRQFFKNAIDYITDEVDLDALTKNTNYAVQGDGIYVIIKNRIGKFIYKIIEHSFPGMPEQFNGNKLALDLPKMPESIYWQIRKMFTDISQEMGEAEAFVQVYYDLVNKHYVVHVPEQEVSKSSVKYDATQNLSVQDPERFVFVYEVHSHNTMGAFWSGTDNADEKETRFFGVLGELDQEEIGEKYRTNILGEYVDLTKEHIFNINDIKKTDVLGLIQDQQTEIFNVEELVALIKARPNYDYPKEWRNNIKKHVYTPSTYQRPPAGMHPSLVNQTWMEEEDEWNWRGGMNWSGGNPRSDKKTKKKKMPDHYDGWGADFEDADDVALMHMMEEEIGERFNLDTVDNGFEEMAYMEIARTIDPNHIYDLMDQLVDHGHEGEMIKFFKKTVGH